MSPRGGAHRRLGSTYRLQVQGIGFTGAAALVPYLHGLGVETLYLSPVLCAVPGSTHGYDVADPTVLDPALGTDEDWRSLLDTLAAHGMGVLLDIVPNHMAAVAANRWWWDVLEHGAQSTYAAVFDIDWDGGDGKVVLPVLGAPLHEVLELGKLTVDRGGPLPVLAYEDHRFPLAPGSQPDGASGRDIAALLDRQHYRLAHWRLGREEINYRRFFDIDGLVGVRIEDEAVYRRTHALVVALAREPAVRGLRVDHVDGLADPGGYLARLRRDTTPAGSGAAPSIVVEKILGHDEAPAPWPVDGLTGYEFAALVSGLLVDPRGAGALAAFAESVAPGSGDMEALTVVARREVLHSLFPGQRRALARAVAAEANRPPRLADVAEPWVADAIDALLARLDVYRLYPTEEGLPADARRRLRHAADRARAGLDADRCRALDALVAVVSGEGAGDGSPGEWLGVSRRFQQLASAVAAKGVEDTASYRFGGLLLGAEVGAEEGVPGMAPVEFHRAMAERQRSCPGSLNATSTHDSKRGEDVSCRLAVLSEMPDAWAGLVRRWRRRHERWRHGPGGTVPAPLESTLYQSMAGVWPWDGRPTGAARRELETRLVEFARKAAREAKQATSWLDPDSGFEHLLERFVRRLLSPAGRPLHDELDALLRRIGPAAATNGLALVVLRAGAPGVPDCYQGTELWRPSLVDPDNRRPVDFPAMAARLERLDKDLAAGPDEAVAAADGAWRDGTAKLLVTRQVLHARRADPQLFDEGAYVPLEVTGPRRAHVVAFARRHRRSWALIVVPRLPLTLAGPARLPTGPRRWERTRVVLPDGAPGEFGDVVHGRPVTVRNGELAVGELLRHLPVALALAPGGSASL